MKSGTTAKELEIFKKSCKIVHRRKVRDFIARYDLDFYRLTVKLYKEQMESVFNLYYKESVDINKWLKKPLHENFQKQKVLL